MRTLAVIASLATLVAACGTGIAEDPDSTGPLPPPVPFGEELVVFDTCDALLDHYVEHALEIVGPYGLPGYGYGGWPPIAVDALAEDAGDDSVGSGEPGRTSTDTNVQVEGVDEADLVKTDGERLFTLVDGRLRIWQVGDGTVHKRGELALPVWSQSMFLHDDTIVVIGTGHGLGATTDLAPDIAPGYGSPKTVVLEVDVTDPSAPEIVRSVTVDGMYAQSRLVDGVMRVAVNSGPVGFEFERPSGGGLRAERDALEANREIIRNSTLDNWLPYSVVGHGGVEREGELLDCADVMVPTEFSGLDTLSILTFDLDVGIDLWDGAGLVASGATMYATADHTYLATQRWIDWWGWEDTRIREASNGVTTHVHLFETTGRAAPRYVASGEIEGFLLNQFAMDEHDDHLRVASTTSPAGWSASGDSESLVTILEIDGADLVEIGRVGGLGVTEQIHAVRFMGEVGYVVTFRRTDPLYVVDLSDPTEPRVTGELKIPGYSAYLHPVGDGRILGLGQDADETGRVEGTQLSLFDVSDPTDPVRIDTVTMDGGWSQAESDHHAFTYVDGLVLAPYERWDWFEDADGGHEVFDAGVLAVTLDGDDLALAAILRAEADGPVDTKGRDAVGLWEWSPLRTVVIDGDILLITRGGVAVFDDAGFERLDWVPNG